MTAEDCDYCPHYSLYTPPLLLSYLLSYDLLQVAFFREVSKTASQQRQLYAASAAVGIGGYCVLAYVYVHVSLLII